jgi:5-methylcytosine-specific restriction protein A
MKVKTKLRRQLWKQQGGKCYYCGQVVSPLVGTLDHFIPRSHGGGGTANYVYACSECNHAKGAKLPEGYESVESTRRIAQREYEVETDRE